MKELPQEFKEKWIAALRSGEYKQDKGALQTNNGYCCLGVAAHLCGYMEDKLMNNIGVLTRRTFANIPDGLLYATAIQQELIEMNDEGKTFNEIADYIEQNL